MHIFIASSAGKGVTCYSKVEKLAPSSQLIHLEIESVLRFLLCARLMLTVFYFMFMVSPRWLPMKRVVSQKFLRG